MKTILKFIGLKVAEIVALAVLVRYSGSLGVIMSKLSIFNWIVDGDSCDTWGLGALFLFIWMLVLALSIILSVVVYKGLENVIKSNWKLAKKKWL